MVESAIVIGLPAPLLMTIIALAPDNIANCSLAVNEQTPRSISAILPSRRRSGTPGTDGITPRPVGSGIVRVSLQLLVAGSLPSRTSTTSPLTSNVFGPNAAPANFKDGPAAGAVTLTSPLTGPSNRYICMVGEPPSAGVAMLALLRPDESCPCAEMASPSTPPRP